MLTYPLALYTMLVSCPTQLLRLEIVLSIMTSFTQQAVETIDRTRGLAGSLFCKLVHQYVVLFIYFISVRNDYTDNLILILANQLFRTFNITNS